jgi:hypothetical protein
MFWVVGEPNSPPNDGKRTEPLQVAEFVWVFPAQPERLGAEGDADRSGELETQEYWGRLRPAPSQSGRTLRPARRRLAALGRRLEDRGAGGLAWQPGRSR